MKLWLLSQWTLCLKRMWNKKVILNIIIIFKRQLLKYSVCWICARTASACLPLPSRHRVAASAEQGAGLWRWRARRELLRYDELSGIYHILLKK
jgi:hypothetical protein